MNTSDPAQSLFKNVFGLGHQVSLYTPKRSARWQGLILGFLFSGGGLLSMLAGAGYVFYQISRFGPAVGDRTIQDTFIPAAVLGGIMILIGLAMLWNTYRNWKLAAAVYKDGFALSNHAGLHILRWTDVATMNSAVTKRYTNGVYTGTTHIYTIVSRQGKKVVLNDSVPNVEALADAVQQGIFPHQYQTAADSYNNGKTVNFGAVSINKGGITIGKKTYPWESVGPITMEKGSLRVAQKGGGWFSGASAPAAAIANLPVLLSILQQVHRSG